MVVKAEDNALRKRLCGMKELAEWREDSKGWYDWVDETGHRAYVTMEFELIISYNEALGKMMKHVFRRFIWLLFREEISELTKRSVALMDRRYTSGPRVRQEGGAQCKSRQMC